MRAEAAVSGEHEPSLAPARALTPEATWIGSEDVVAPPQVRAAAAAAALVVGQVRHLRSAVGAAAPVRPPVIHEAVDGAALGLERAQDFGEQRARVRPVVHRAGERRAHVGERLRPVRKAQSVDEGAVSILAVADEARVQVEQQLERLQWPVMR